MLVGTALAVSHDPAAQATLALLLQRGLVTAIRVTLTSFGLALVFGLIAGLGRVSKNRLARELATLYVEVVRGIPLLVLILWIGYALIPLLVQAMRDGLLALNAGGTQLGGLIPRLVTLTAPCSRPSACVPEEMRGTLGLAVGYGAYIAEIIRAGIQSVPHGQTEAAQSLGLSRWQTLRFIVLPQALRLALPPLGNDFVALLKDSSLISVLAVREIVYVARVEIARTFQAIQVWNLVALLYLVLTITLSAGVHYLERRME
jgi:polar amino acid transport system permease protein